MSESPHDPDLDDQNAKDINYARGKTLIDVVKVRSYLHNGHQEWTRREGIIKVLSDDPTFDKSQREYMSRTDRYNRGLRMTNRIFDLQVAHNWSQRDSDTAISILDDSLPIALHNAAFEPVIKSQGGPLLNAKYGELIANRGILGCYLQTELAHGSNVRGLETAATYIPETREFDIHSPTFTSSKWWVGALGKTSTHGVVQAQLILPDGKEMGPHLFLVQLRSLSDHRLLPGIIAGDIGPKALGGYSPTDNGFARFNHVRIPKENMLSQFAQVTDEGTYVQPPHAKLGYGSMLYIRSSMITAAGWIAAKGATISIRYATVRRQGETESPSGLERQVISYPSLQYRLFPILSRAYVFVQLGRDLTKSFDDMSTRLSAGDTSRLAEMHAITSGLKSLVSGTVIADLETARRSMGGHGYSAFAGIGRIYADYLPAATYEGENHVLDQQVVRSALKAFRGLFTSEAPSVATLPPSSHYLHLLLDPTNEPPVLTESSWDDADTCIQLLEWRAAVLVNEVARTKEDPDAGISQRVSKAVTEAFVAGQVGKMLGRLGDTSGLREYDAQIVRKVYNLYLLTTVETGLVDLLSFGLLRLPKATTRISGSRDPTRSLRMAITNLCAELLPDAIGLTDAFGFTDWELDSALGRYDGKAYQALWDHAQREPLNQTEVPAAYEESIRPILRRGQALSRRDGSKL